MTPAAKAAVANRDFANIFGFLCVLLPDRIAFTYFGNLKIRLGGVRRVCGKGKE